MSRGSGRLLGLLRLNQVVKIKIKCARPRRVIISGEASLVVRARTSRSCPYVAEELRNGELRFERQLSPSARALEERGRPRRERAPLPALRLLSAVRGD